MSVLNATKRFMGYFDWGFYFGTGLDCCTPVSYTHLDVYKRQVYTSVPLAQVLSWMKSKFWVKSAKLLPIPLLLLPSTPIWKELNMQESAMQ